MWVCDGGVVHCLTFAHYQPQWLPWKRQRSHSKAAVCYTEASRGVNTQTATQTFLPSPDALWVPGGQFSSSASVGAWHQHTHTLHMIHCAELQSNLQGESFTDDLATQRFLYLLSGNPPSHLLSAEARRRWTTAVCCLFQSIHPLTACRDKHLSCSHGDEKLIIANKPVYPSCFALDSCETNWSLITTSGALSLDSMAALSVYVCVCVCARWRCISHAVIRRKLK